MKMCNKCKVEKSELDFHKDKSNSTGLYSSCKSCKSNYVVLRYRSNPEKYRQDRKDRYAANPEKEREQSMLRSRVWRKENPAHRNALKAAYKASKLKATPSWADAKEVLKFYETATALGMHTGEWYHVDHIVPLRNTFVCGLHNEFNLQILTAKANMKKHNTFEITA